MNLLITAFYIEVGMFDRNSYYVGEGFGEEELEGSEMKCVGSFERLKINSRIRSAIPLKFESLSCCGIQKFSVFHVTDLFPFAKDH